MKPILSTRTLGAAKTMLATQQTAATQPVSRQDSLRRLQQHNRHQRNRHRHRLHRPGGWLFHSRFCQYFDPDTKSWLSAIVVDRFRMIHIKSSSPVPKKAPCTALPRYRAPAGGWPVAAMSGPSMEASTEALERSRPHVDVGQDEPEADRN